jgi:hypothetical protein
MSFLTRKRAILSKIETTYGVDPTPAAGSDALLMSNLTISPLEMTLVQRQNIKAYMGNNPNVIAASYSKVSFDIEMAGSGSAGTAPAFDELLRGCALSATTLAAPVTGTATAGSTTSITLGASASAVDGTYNGLTIYITGGTGSGQNFVIANYVGATKVATLTSTATAALDATSVYNIPAQVVYKPVSSNLESVTFYCFVDGLLHKMLGARGSVAMKASAQGIPMFTFTFTGLFAQPSDTTIPAVSLTLFQQPLAINAVNTAGLNVSGYTAAACSDFSFDLANAIAFRSLPGAADNVVLTDRKPVGSITIELTTVAAKDWWSTMRNVVLGPFSVTHGTVAGNKVKIDAPQMQLDTPSDGDKDGITMLTMKQTFNPQNGNDELTLCFM